MVGKLWKTGVYYGELRDVDLQQPLNCLGAYTREAPGITWQCYTNNDTKQNGMYKII